MVVVARVVGLVVLVAALGGGCATSSSSEGLRELPAGLQSAGALLTGCAPEGDADIVRARCDGEVMLAVKTRLPGAPEPGYKGEAFALAQLSGGRLVWDQIVVATEGPSGTVDRARVMGVSDQDPPSATLVGVVRDLGERRVQEVWCTSVDDPGDRRCRDLVGAVLSGDPAAARENDPAKIPPRTSSAPVNLFGRALSLPTSCSGRMSGDGGDASCADGASLSWRKLGTMDEATQMVAATLSALGAEEGEPFACKLANETAQCEDHGRAVAAIAYVDGAPVAVLCLGVLNAREHGLCKAVIRP